MIFFSNALSKGGIYYLSFLSEYADSSLKNHGHLAIPALTLDSLPLAMEAADEYNLGILSIEDGSVSSGLSTEQCVSGSGYVASTLERLGGYDTIALKFFNPDINRNQVIDAEENLPWLFWALYRFTLDYQWINHNDSTLVDSDNQLLHLENHLTQLGRYQNILFIELPDTEIHQDTFAAGYTLAVSCTVPGGEVMNFDEDYTNVSTDGGTSRIGTQWKNEEGLNSLDSPFDGDYTLTAGSKEYYFDNIQFVSPIKNLTNLVLALPFLQTDSSGKAIGITWTWVEYTGTGYDILTREVK